MLNIKVKLWIKVLCLSLLYFCLAADATLPESCTESEPAVEGGLDLFSRGIDITQFNMDDQKSTGFKDKLFDFTFENVCSEKSAADCKKENIPDQLAIPVEEPNPKLRTSPRTFRSFVDMKKRMAERSGVILDFGKFSNNELYLGRSREINEFSNIISEVFSSFNTVDVSVNPNITLTLGKSTSDFLENLTLTYEENPASYQKFITKFGTHYITWGRFGQYVKNQFLISKDFHLLSSEQDITDQSLKYFMNKYRGPDGNRTDADTDQPIFEVNEDFVSNSRSHDWTNLGRNFEGFPHTTNMRGVDFIQRYPWITKAQLKPIYGLIKKDKKRFSMFRAVQNYLQKAYLSDLEWQIRSTLIRYEKISDLKPKLEKLESNLGRILNQSSSTPFNYSEIKSIAGNVRFNLIKPKWWRHVELCFEFENDEPDMYCSGVTPSCAKTNHYTDMFKDWSRNAGGCKLSWRLNTPLSTEKWFYEVKLCYRYFATSNNWEQCGSDGTSQNEEICSSFSENGDIFPMIPYYDHTDNRQGGCKLSWKISIPEEKAPNWFLNVRFCYFYNGDQKCAFVNEFTHDYLDDTYFRNYIDYRENLIQWAIIDDL